MGVMALSNNIGPMIDGFQMVTKETGSMKSGMGVLLKSMVGPMGLSIAFSLVIAAIQAYSFLSAKAGREAKEMGKKSRDAGEDINFLTISLEDLNKKLKDISSEKAQEGIDQIAEKIQALRDKEEEWFQQSGEYVLAGGLLGSAAKAGGDSEEIKGFLKITEILKSHKSLIGKINDLDALRSEKILERRKLREDEVGFAGKLLNLNNRILEIDKEKKKLLKTSADLEKERLKWIGEIQKKSDEANESALARSEQILSELGKKGDAGTLMIPVEWDFIPIEKEKIIEKLDPVTDVVLRSFNTMKERMGDGMNQLSDSLAGGIVSQWQHGISAMTAFENAFKRMWMSIVAQIMSKAIIFGILSLIPGLGPALGVTGGFMDNVFGGSKLTAGGGSKLKGGGNSPSNLIASPTSGSLSTTNLERKVDTLTRVLIKKDFSPVYTNMLEGQTLVRDTVKPELDMIDRKNFKKS